MALSDLLLAAPLVSRVLFRSKVPGRLVGVAALGAYLGSATRDRITRRQIRPLDFRETFGLDTLAPTAQPQADRVREVERLGRAVERLYASTPLASRSTREERARRADGALVAFIAEHTGQRVLSSITIRNFMIPSLLFPFALGACDPISGEVGIFRDLGIFEPHVIAHEFSHRKGYFREVEAQLLAYLSLASSNWREGQLSALAERLYRQISILGDKSPRRCRTLLETLRLPGELEAAFTGRIGMTEGRPRVVVAAEQLYDWRMRMTGQNGLSDYDVGFTNGLWFIETRPKALATVT